MFKKLLAFIIICFVWVGDAYALDEFKTSYFVTYDNNVDGESTVTQKIQLTNLKDDVVATNYSISLKQLQIYDIEATDEKGAMKVEQTTAEDTTTVIATFNENMVGRGRVSEFTIKYKTKNIVTKLGEIYTIKIPKVAGLINVRDYNVELIIPDAFGPRVFITPEPAKLREDTGKTAYVFEKEQLEDSGISASFGKYQVLNYKLKYQLENKYPISTLQEIALPPDIQERQYVSHKQITPEPKRIYTDDDGNLIAQYIVKPNNNLEIELVGSVRILGKQINPDLGGRFTDIDTKLVKKYTKEKIFWETKSPEIQAVKNKLFEPDSNVTKNAKNIYNYVVGELNYDRTVIEKDYVERYGATKTLSPDTPAACMEFTDLFIALARSMGIPARELNGYAINVYQKVSLPLSIKLKSGDLLHSWPEFYDPNFGWVPVDPTWGNTSKLDFFSKLDNSHFVFAIKGNSSEYPLPAGLYRKDSDAQLVSVEVSQVDSENDFQHYAAFYKRLNLNPIQLLMGKDKYYVKNLGGTYIYNLSGNTILPYEVKTIFLDKNLDEIQYQDGNGKIHSQSIILLDKNPKTFVVNPFSVIFSTLLGLLLCSLSYYLLILKGYLKKLPRLHLRHPQDQDQKQSQNS